ncbi:MAG: hypothetical protein CL610_10740 [Anaerolineaceae bacterium]|nr:hypothetical protein [Anaerolineaceae bacterium]
MELETRPASDVSTDALVDAFNNGYSGYTIPVHVNEHELRHHIEQNDIDLNQSRVAVHQGKIVGVVLLGLRDTTGWIGGLGVHPDYRRHGIGTVLMKAALETAQALKLSTVQLEVIDSNTAAYVLYQQLGFAATRKLLVLSSPPQLPAAAEAMNAAPTTLADALQLHQRFHTSPPPWQRAHRSLSQVSETVRAWVSPDVNQPQAYALGYVTGSSIHFLDMACASDQTATLQTLIQHIMAQHDGSTARIINVGEDEPAASALLNLGWQTILAQYEMHHPLVSFPHSG